MRTYGLYSFRDDLLGVKLEAMAAIRFKRLFERASKHVAEWIALTATAENARELEWFMQRYPLAPRTPDDAVRLDRLAREFDHRMAMVERILAQGYEPPRVELALPPRPYQLLPAEMAMASGGLLCLDELGLGKTVEAIVLLAKEGALPALFVTLTHLPIQVEREINRFLPGLTTYRLRTGSPLAGDGVSPLDLAKKLARGIPLDRPRRTKTSLPPRMPDVVVTSYSKLPGWSQWLIENMKPRTVIWDEPQEFRRGHGTLRGAAGLYVAEHVERRMGLTNTPIHNEGSEIWPVMECILPGALGSHTEFVREWCGYDPETGRGGDGNVTKPEALGAYLRERGLVIGRTKAEVGRELPPLTISEQFCEADPAVLDGLKKSSRAVELARFVLSGTRAAFQAAGEFDLFVRQQTGLAKAPFVAAFVDMLLQSGEPVVLGGWHHAVYDVWRDLLAEHKPVFFTGRESAPQKDAALRVFRDGETKLFILSVRSGAGIDGLQYAGCSNVVFGELDWSPAVHEQFIGRVRRDGINVPVTAWFLVSDEGSDPVMAERLGVKRGQLQGLRDPNGKVVAGQTDPDAIKKLAADFLARRGISAPASTVGPAQHRSIGIFEDDRRAS